MLLMRLKGSLHFDCFADWSSTFSHIRWDMREMIDKTNLFLCTIATDVRHRGITIIAIIFTYCIQPLPLWNMPLNSSATHSIIAIRRRSSDRLSIMHHRPDNSSSQFLLLEILGFSILTCFYFYLLVLSTWFRASFQFNLLSYRSI